MKYETKFINKRTYAVEFTLSSGHRIVFKPESEETLYTDDDRALWSRFSQVSFLKNGTIKATPNPEWKPYWDKDAWTVTFKNIDGSESEAFYLEPAENPVSVPRGMELEFPVSLNSSYIRCKEVRIEYKQRLEKVGRSNHYRKVKRLTRDCVPRSKSELKKIEAQIEKEHAKVGKQRAAVHAEAVGVTEG